MCYNLIVIFKKGAILINESFFYCVKPENYDLEEGKGRTQYNLVLLINYWEH